jgi:hypothetical protein
MLGGSRMKYFIYLFVLSVSLCACTTLPTTVSSDRTFPVLSHYFGDNANPQFLAFEDKLNPTLGFDRLAILHVVIKDPLHLLKDPKGEINKDRPQALMVVGRETIQSEAKGIFRLTLDSTAVAYSSISNTYEYLVVIQTKIDSIELKHFAFTDAELISTLIVTSNILYTLKPAAINYLGRLELNVAKIPIIHEVVKELEEAAAVLRLKPNNVDRSLQMKWEWLSILKASQALAKVSGETAITVEQDTKQLEEDMAWFNTAQPKLQLPENLQSSILIAPYVAGNYYRESYFW